MGRQYSARTFLRNAPNELLRRFFDQRGVDLGINWGNAHETDVNGILVAIEQLPADTRAAIDSDFAMINELACEAGCVALIEKAGNPDGDWARRFATNRGTPYLFLDAHCANR